MRQARQPILLGIISSLSPKVIYIIRFDIWIIVLYIYTRIYVLNVCLKVHD
jgi:hypothetical protein